MLPWVGEFFGTMLLVFLGTGVVANAVLANTKGNGSGFLFITVGWAVAVMVPAMAFANISGSHFNPALTIGIAIHSGVWDDVPMYIVGQFAGGLVGAFLTWVFYKDHFDATEDKGAKLGTFATGPAMRNLPLNFINELLATFVLVFVLLTGLGAAGPMGEAFAIGVNFLGVGGLILVIGIALGGTTGYALNPARDLSPRIIHALVPIKDKGDSDWGYAWVPVAGPVAGAVIAALLVGVF